ncbi:MAG: MotA/TolQ/ExbB proton channel family protein [Flexistipes sinusarabici]|uniref:MotA/TolQ/ExbB proton channel family protein n=1 Tax=Flexistipes sinusarabici TaxID=2352 RepID=A0A5D0MJ57_FLESI|nr:MotA/TolQ/ExbB proton channel family protein [Flexistipes sinusarabici]TYB33717.1 MAG: MotA/TolQ/ExbB proton channel family protein [Flexistipes sinusarabici]
MLEILEKGGVLMYPILLLSIISLAVFLERLISLRKNRYVPKNFMDKLYVFLRNKSFQDARSLCDMNSCAIGDISKTILDNLDLPISRLMELSEEAGRFQAKKLERFLPTLQTIANIAPLLGLLGTVIGMIKTFIVISQQGVGNAQALAGGISEALLTTAAGLSVAIPTVIFYHIINSRSERVVYELEGATSNILNLIFKEETK